ncbi:MAG: RDD family protein [Luteimonas sp.]
MVPAGFWRRYAAWSLDTVVIVLPVALILWPQLQAGGATLAHAHDALLHAVASSFMQALLSGTTPDVLASQWLADPVLLGAIGALQHAWFGLLWPPLLAFVLFGTLYHVGFETSAHQSTPGQRLLGLRVVDLAGRRVNVGRALLRQLAGALSWLTLNIGHLLAWWRADKRTLHDLASGTRVLQADAGGKLPAWTQAWLVLQILILLWAAVACMSASLHIMQAGFDSAL